jgi:methylated-DNA-protein-cysteine methyltransferase-like protein
MNKNSIRARPRVMQSTSAGFFTQVYVIVRQVPRGHVVTYGQIAHALGSPRAARSVGWAMRDCPDDVPWHRVVNARGEISLRPTAGYPEQRARLRDEGVRFDRAGKIDLKKYGWEKI